MLFTQIPGLHKIKDQLTKDVKNGRIPHAQLFYGNEGNSGFQLSLAYARYIFCSDRQPTDSCGKCSSCKQFNSYNYPDLHFSFPMASKGTGAISCAPYMSQWISFLKSNAFFNLDQWTREVGIDKKKVFINVKEGERIYETMNLRAYSGGYKIQLIYCAETLNPQAANKLLKLIEEPTANTLILLISDYPERILQTILSRCQKLFIPKHTDIEIGDYLEMHLNQASQASLSIAHYSNGSISNAIALSEEHERLNKNAQIFADWFRACFTANAKDILSIIDHISKYSRDGQKSFLIFVSQIVRERLQAKFETDETTNPVFDGVNFKAQGFTDILHTTNASYLLELLNEAIFDILRNGNGRIILLDLSLKLSNALKMKEPISN